MPLTSELIIQQLLGALMKMITNTSIVYEVNQIFQEQLPSQWMLNAKSFPDLCYESTGYVVPFQIALDFTFVRAYS